MRKVSLTIGLFSISLIICLVFSGTSEALPKYSDLYPYLIDLKGWTAGPPTGMNMTGPDGEMVTAERHYKKDNTTLNVSIISGIGAYSAWAPFSMGITLDSPDTFMKTFSLKGYPAGLSHNKKNKSGGVVVLIQQAGPQSVVLVFDYTGLNYNEAISLIKGFPLKKIEGAFK